ncbi:MAG: FtsX-like permease family protein [Gemmatimonadales bacterium]|nr:FtsX-like permease family protein [Gemmatimonadales bacterium]NIO31550.1 FtsX-like permease family protein [Gemmatimonadota bacterium]
MNSFLQEIRYAGRTLGKARGFTLVAVLTLGLGIAASTVIFSFVNGVLLRPLPYRSPRQLLFVWDRLEWVDIPRAWVTPPQVADLRDETTLFEGFAALRTGTTELTGTAEPEQLETGLASANLFSLLGINTALGRAFLPGDDEAGAPNVAVLSDGFWRRRFGNDSTVIGRSVTLGGRPTTIVGVLPPGFDFLVHSSLGSPQGVDIWQPYQVDLANGSRGDHSLAVLARIRDGISFEQAKAELEAVGRRQDERWFGNNGFTFVAAPVHSDLVKQARPILLILFGAAGLVLLIASANVATLMIARAQQRQRDVAIRRALGASRGRVVRQALAEAALLSTFAAAVGLTVAYLTLDTLVALAPDALPRRQDIAIHPMTFAFIGLAVALTTAICGSAPGILSLRSNPAGILRCKDRRIGPRARSISRNGIVIAEIGLSILLLFGAGLLVRSFVSMQHIDPGFDRQGVLAFDVLLPDIRYPTGIERRALVTELLKRIGQLPGVTDVGATSGTPLSAGASQIDAKPLDVGESESFMVDYMMATPDYFKAMGVDLIEGRSFTPDDGPEAPRVAIIDETLTRRWPDGEAIGRQLALGGSAWTVVGVVRHARLYNLYADDRPQVYLPYARIASRSFSIVLRTTGDPIQLADAARRELALIDPSQPVANVRTMVDMAQDSIADRRLAMLVMTGFSVAAMLLASLGIYGILSHYVADRRYEIGIRIALGAQRAGTVRMVAQLGIKLTVIGIALGLAGAVALSRVMAGLVYGISPTDPTTFAAISASMLVVAMAACYLPARRATRVDPMVVLKGE